MPFFSNLFSKSTYLYDTLESLTAITPENIVLNFEKINPTAYDNASYSDNNAIIILGKDKHRALLFGILHSNKPPEKRIELWQKKEEEKGTKRMLKIAPSTRNLPNLEDRSLQERFARLKQGGRRKNKKTRKDVSKKSIRRKSVRRKSVRRKSVRQKSMRQVSAKKS